MHLGNGAITQECAALGFAAAAAGVGVSLMMARKSAQPISLPKAAALGALVFAAQMINLPVLQTSSAHFVGGVLLAELLGPALGVLTMSAVLLIQAVVLGDGGTAALGVNIVNMALVPAGAVVLLRRAAANRWLGLSAASLISILLAVLLIAGEVALGRSSIELATWSGFVSAMIAAHLPALVLEAALTLALVVAWNRLESRELVMRWQVIAVTVGVAVLMIAAAGHVSSELPDGYESSAETAQMEWLLADRP